MKLNELEKIESVCVFCWRWELSEAQKLAVGVWDWFYMYGEKMSGPQIPKQFMALSDFFLT